MKNKKLKALLLISLLFFKNYVYGQHLESLTSEYWQLSTHGTKPLEGKVTVSRASKASEFTLNINQLRQHLNVSHNQFVSIPLPNGNYVEFKLFPTKIMALELAQKYPNIRTFDGIQIDNPQNKGKFDLTPHGFHGVFSYYGKQVYLDPLYRGDNLTYQSYFRENALPLGSAKFYRKLPPREHALLLGEYNAMVINNQLQRNAIGNLHTYKIAISATGEYSAFHGGTKELALAAIVTLLNRINEVYQQDVAIKLELVAQNDAIIFLDAATDPFENTDNDIDVNSDVINNAIGVNSYDIGHVVGTGGGGLASLGAVCSVFKAEGVTGSPVPTNDAFYIDFVAHELGHQFGANHTFNGTTSSCDGNRSSSSAYEVGSASTIMGYAGICGEENLQNNSDAYFHIHSIDQIRSFMQGPTGSSCGTIEPKTNQTPEVDAGTDQIIPARTAFMLSGQATDVETDSLTYSWEEFDLGTASASKLEAKTDDGSRPLFRNFVPKSTASRSFPNLVDLVNNQSSFGESLPTTDRDLNFRLVVRDTQGNLADDAIKVTVVANNEGFHVIEPSISASWNGGQQAVTWNTANSELAPINCNQVDIYLSQNSATSFEWLLINKTPNDGNELVNLPHLITTLGRIKIACSDNVFFAINASDISINSDGSFFDSKPEFISQAVLTLSEDQSLTINKSDFSFVNNLKVDAVIIGAGDNYQVSGNTITPTGNFNGNLAVAITATKGEFTSDVFTASVSVNAVNDLPISNNDSANVEQDSSNNIIDVIANDSDVDNDTLTLTAVNYSGIGSVSISDNKVSYSPAAGFSGGETLMYTINDGNQGNSSASLNISVKAKSVVVDNANNNGSSSGGGSVWWLLSFLLLTLIYSSFSVKTTEKITMDREYE